MAQQTDDQSMKDMRDRHADAESTNAVPAGWVSLDAWAELDERTPERRDGDASAAARIAATLLKSARQLRAEFGDQMLSIDAEPTALRLHELLHVTERNALAAQRHGVESLTARLRGDDGAVRSIAAETFDRVGDAADSLRGALGVAPTLLTNSAAAHSGEDAHAATEEVATEEAATEEVATEEVATEEAATEEVADHGPAAEDVAVSERLSRAARMRQERPIPDSPPSAPVDEPGSYSADGEEWPGWARLDEPIELRAEPVPAKRTDTSSERFTGGAQLEVIPLSTGSLPEPISVGRLWMYRALVVILVLLIIFGLWLLLSSNSFIA